MSKIHDPTQNNKPTGRSNGILTGSSLAEAAIETLSIGTKTLADLSYGPPPDPLIGDFLTPGEPNILYGPGGVGKGMMSVWFTKKLTESDHNIMIIDFEGHEGEWGRRSHDMGFTDDQKKRVHYREPFGPSWAAPGEGRTLNKIADLIKRDCDRLNISVILIDSYTAATSNADNLGGQGPASEYFEALAKIGRTSLTIAHIAGGGAEKFPDKPFGSVFVHNFARETWAMNSAENPVEVEYTAEDAAVAPNVMTVELRNKKMSQRRKVPDPKFVSFSFFPDGHIEVDDTAGNPSMTIAEMIYNVIERSGSAQSARETTRLVNAEYGEKKSEGVIRETLKRGGRGITFVAHTDTVPTKYSIRTPKP